MLLSELPIIQAPMAGGPSTPELVAGVNDAGGYGFIAAGYLSATKLNDVIVATRALTNYSFGVNLFVPSAPGDANAIATYAALLQVEADRLGVALGDAKWEDDAFEEKLAVVEQAKVHLVSFTFGCPEVDVVERLHRAGALVAVTVTSTAEAKIAEAVGVDFIAAQGTEAGGHQGSFLDLSPNERPVLELVREISSTTSLPTIATGGIMNGEQVNGALHAGAVAVQLGTAFLCADEAGTSAPYRDALLQHRYDGTMITRAFSGRYARGLTNRFAREYSDKAPEAYPEIHHLTRPLRAAATAAGDSDIPNLWAGTGWRDVKCARASNIVRRIAKEMNNAEV